jgi:WD40 repeat protein
MSPRLRTAVTLIFIPAIVSAAEPRDDPLPAGAIMRLGSTRWRPGGYVFHFMFSRDGTRLYTWNERGTPPTSMTEWDVATGRPVRNVELPGARVLAWQRLADGRGLAVVQAERGAFVWEFTEPKAQRPPLAPLQPGGIVIGRAADLDAAAPTSFLITPDAKFVYVGYAANNPGREQPIKRYDLLPLRYVSDLPGGQDWAMQPDNCRGLFTSPDGKTLVSLSSTKKGDMYWTEVLMVVRDAETGKERRRFTSPAPLAQGYRWTVAVSDKLVAIGVGDDAGTLVMRELGSEGERRIATGHRDERYPGVSAVIFSTDGRRIVTAGRDAAIKVWDAASGKELRAIRNAFPSWIEALALSPDDRRLACSGQAGLIRHFDLDSGAELGASPEPAGQIGGVALTADGRGALTTSFDGMLHVWNLARGEVRYAWRITNLPLPRTWLGLAPDGRTALAGDRKSLGAWDTATGKPLALLELPTDFKSHYAAFARDGRTVVAFRTDGVTLLDWPSGKPSRDFDLAAMNRPITVNLNAGSLSPDGRWLALGYERRTNNGREVTLDLFDATTGALAHRLVDGSGNMYSVHFTPSGDLLFVGGPTLHPIGGADVTVHMGRLHLIDPLTGRLRRTFDAPPPGPTHWFPGAVTPSPDGRTVYCAGGDGAIHVYEAATGKIRHSLPGHRDYIAAMTCSRDGRRLLTGSGDMTALLWDVSLAAGAKENAHPPTELLAALRGEDAAAAYAAMARLSAKPTEAVALFRGALKPATKPAAADALLDRLTADLADESFAAREKASRELDALGGSAVEGMRQRLLKTPSPEARRRIAKYIDKHDPAPLLPERLLEERGLELLEHVNTPESRALLAKLAKGAAGASLTRAAAESLKRAEDIAK